MGVYVVAVFLTQLVADHKHYSDPMHSENPSELTEYYGSLFTSILSLYQAITGGADWRDVMRPLMDEINGSLAVLFVLYIAFTVMVMLNLVTGVFVEGAQRNIKKKDQERQCVNNLRKLFSRSSVEREGQITLRDFRDSFGSDWMQEFFKVVDVPTSEAQDTFRLIDQRGKNVLTVEEFVMGGLKLSRPSRGVDVARLHRLILDQLRTSFRDLEHGITRSVTLHRDRQQTA